MTLHVLTIDIFEAEIGEDYPVVSHQFYGKTQDEARGYYKAHLMTDKFLADCVEHGKWNGVDCWAESHWDTCDDFDEEFEDDDDD